MNGNGQRGFTLIEMLVTLMIAGIFFSIFMGVILATFETLRSGDERTVAQQNARVAINYIANEIRHASDITPLRFEAYRDWATGGFPVDKDVYDPYYPSATIPAWPIYRRSVDSAPVDANNDGYIDLDITGGTGDGDEYVTFRENGDLRMLGLPFDVRPLAPNRISLAYYGTSYYPNTEYWGPLGSVDMDSNFIPDPTAANTIVTFEHQLVEPLHPEIYEKSFSGRVKQFDMVVNRTGATGIQDTSDFVIYRTLESDNPTVGPPDVGQTNNLITDPGTLGTISDQFRIDEPYLRQPVADHVVNIRFRYWYISGNEMMEIRYDPDTSNIGSGGTGTDDGYYRYFDIYGNEIYAWYDWDAGADVPLLPTGCSCGDPEWDSVPGNAFYIDGGVDSDDRTQQGILLFEGWRFVNAISIDIKTANNQTLDIYRSTINQSVTNPSGPFYDFTHPDYGMGFIDFGLGNAPFSDPTGTLNTFEPLYQGADNVRISTSTVGGSTVFDFVEPNMNPNYDPNSFTTFQTLVAPPALKPKAEAAVRMLSHGLSHTVLFGT